MDNDGEGVPADVGESSPEELAPPDGVEEIDPKRLPVGDMDSVLESLLIKEVDAERLLDGDAEACAEADAETVRAPVTLPDAESRFTVVDAATEGVTKPLSLALPERETALLSD